MLVWRHLAAIAAALMVSLVASAGAEAGSRHGGHGFGGPMRAGPSHVARIAYAPAMRAHVPMHVARPYTAASYAPRVHHAHYAQARVVRYAAPVQQVRYVHYQPTVHHQATYSTMYRHGGRACNPRPHCVC
jgi:hypothetical protein